MTTNELAHVFNGSNDFNDFNVAINRMISLCLAITGNGVSCINRRREFYPLFGKLN